MECQCTYAEAYFIVKFGETEVKYILCNTCILDDVFVTDYYDNVFIHRFDFKLRDLIGFKEVGSDTLDVLCYNCSREIFNVWGDEIVVDFLKCKPCEKKPRTLKELALQKIAVDRSVKVPDELKHFIFKVISPYSNYNHDLSCIPQYKIETNELIF